MSENPGATPPPNKRPDRPTRVRMRAATPSTDVGEARRRAIAAIPLNDDQKRMLDKQEEVPLVPTRVRPSETRGSMSHDEYMKAQHDELRRQLREVQEELSPQEGRSGGPMLPQHRRQKYIGGLKDGRRIYSCTVASAINGLDALGLDPHETDDSLIAEIGGVAEFEPSGFLDIGKVLRYLRESRGLNAPLNFNLRELVSTLDTGGVTLLAYGGHARLISGYQVTGGEVRLQVNDPLYDTVQTPRLQDVVDGIIATNDHYNIASITKRPQAVPGRVRLVPPDR